jgi:hypothetical protein
MISLDLSFMQGVRARMVDKDFAPKVFIVQGIYTSMNSVTSTFSLLGNYLKCLIPKFAVGST